MKRGDLVVVAFSGDLGKPRPALVLQSDAFDQTSSVILAPITTHIIDAPALRIDVEPRSSTGLKKPSQIMLDKISSLSRGKIASRIGSLDGQTLESVDRALGRLLGLS